MKHIAIVLFLFSGLGVSAQAPLVKQWDKAFGGGDFELLYSIQQTAEEGYILGGASSSGISGDKTQTSWGSFDYWIVKTDSLGSKQWDKRFGGTGDDRLYSLQQTIDRGYILGGYSGSDSSGDRTQPSWGIYDYWAVKIDSLGNKQWDKRFGGIREDRLYSLQQTIDGGYILGGYSNSDSSGDKTQPSRGSYDYWLVKIDSFGNKEWDKRFGGDSVDLLYSLQQTVDGGYILGGQTRSGISGDKTQSLWGNWDYWIVKTDALGNKQWDKRFGGDNYDALYYLKQTIDGGYILGGISSSGISGDKTQSNWGSNIDGDYWIVKIDSLGTKQWDKRFGGIGNEDEFGNIFQTTDGGFLIAGTSYSNSSGDKSQNNLGTEQTWVIKTDSNGYKQWDKTLLTLPPSPFIHDEIGFALQTKEGCYAIANYTEGGIAGDKTQTKRGNSDYWLIKFCDTTQATHCNLASPNISASQSQFCANDSTLICAATIYTNYHWNNGEVFHYK